MSITAILFITTLILFVLSAMSIQYTQPAAFVFLTLSLMSQFHILFK